MPIERLLYTQNGSNPLNLSYKEIKINAITRLESPNKSIRNLLRNNTDNAHFRNSIPISVPKGNIFRMGWNAAVVFEKKGSGLTVTKIFDIRAKKQNLGIVNTAFNQITTQGIDTCTIVYIETQNKCLFAHFEKTEEDTGNFIALLDKLFHNGEFDPKNIQKIFFSGIYSMQREVCIALEQLNGPDKLIYFNRFSEDKPYYYFSHVEFGICWNGSKFTYMGDLICRAFMDAENSCLCYTFEYGQIEALSEKGLLGRGAQDLEEQEPKGPEAKKDKSCTII